MGRSLVLVVLGLGALVAPVCAETGAFTRFRDGGPARTECMLVSEVAGVTPSRAARCTDGDPSCDADGRADGTCVFQVRLCIDATDLTTMPRCHGDVVTRAQVSLTSPALAPLAAALEALPMPVTEPDTCTATVSVPVARHARHAGRAALRASVTMASGHADRDRLALVCQRPPGARATFDTIQRKILGPSCSTLSCHGAGNAGGLTLAPGSAYESLVGVPPANTAAREAGLLRVAPGDPERSFLLRKLEGALSADEGLAMPRVGTPLPAASIDLVRRWIAAGAPADASF